MSSVLNQNNTTSDNYLFKQALNHPAFSCKSMEDARRLLSEEHPFTYMILDGGQGSIYICFYDKQQEFHAHYCQVIEKMWKNGTGRRWDETGVEKCWKNGAHKTYKHIDDLIVGVMGVKDRDETPFIDNVR